MEITNIAARLKEIVASEDLLSHASEVKDLEAQVNGMVQPEPAEPAENSEQPTEEAATPDTKEATAEEPEAAAPAVDPALVQEALALVNDYKAKKSALLQKKKDEEAQNLKVKQELLADLRDLIQNEENIGKAFDRIKNIREQWKETGQVAREKYTDIQNEYSKLNETFNYNINIYKELKEHDLKRNFSLKNQIVHQIADLKSIKDVKTVEKELARLRNEWDEIGGTYRDKWEIIKEKYWTNVRAIYDKLNAHYEDQRKVQAENLEAKKALLGELKKVVEKDPSGLKDWQNTTNDIKDIQKRWKEIGFSSRKETQPVWQELRNICNDFFDKKKNFFDSKKSENKGNQDRKRALIDKVNALKDSRDWRETSKQIIQLQKEWKKIGHAGPHAEHKLWKEFRGSCDHFFKQKDQYYSELEGVFEENVKKREAFIKGIEKEKFPDSVEEALGKILELSQAFSELGDIPNAKQKGIDAGFRKAIQKCIESTKIPEADRAGLFYKAKLESWKSSGNQDAMVEERQRLRRDIKKIEENINKTENNLSFFSVSKGAEGLLADTMGKIEQDKKKVAQLKEKVKLINIALR